MLANLGYFFSVHFRRWLPDSFVFAILLTLIAGLLAFFLQGELTGSGLFNVVIAWQKGLWDLLAFAMQMVLILVTGYSIAISPAASKGIDWLASKIKTPNRVYMFVTVIGCIFTLISWGWIVLTAILARSLAHRIAKVDYRFLTACVYITFLPWHGGLSGSIPLLLNTPGNFLIENNLLTDVIPTALTLTSPMNLLCNLGLIVTLPLLMYFLKPKSHQIAEIDSFQTHSHIESEMSVEEEAKTHCLAESNFSDFLNNSQVLQFLMVALGTSYLVWHFINQGFNVTLNIMNLIFLMLGMFFHKTPLRYMVAMKRACSNVSEIILQFPFYAGIMGIMIHTGLGETMATWLTQIATVETLPFLSLVIGGFVNLFVPSGGGEWAVIGPTILEAARDLGVNMTPDAMQAYLARVSMATAYGDSWTNMIQPFWTLTFFPVVAKGLNLKARDIMGYTFIAMIWVGIVFGLSVTYLPI